MFILFFFFFFFFFSICVYRVGIVFASLEIIHFMIPKSKHISGCIQVILTFFLVSSTLTLPSRYTFLLVFHLSFIVLFLLENRSKWVCVSIILPFLQKAAYCVHCLAMVFPSGNYTVEITLCQCIELFLTLFLTATQAPTLYGWAGIYLNSTNQWTPSPIFCYYK